MAVFLFPMCTLSIFALLLIHFQAGDLLEKFILTYMYQKPNWVCGVMPGVRVEMSKAWFLTSLEGKTRQIRCENFQTTGQNQIKNTLKKK